LTDPLTTLIDINLDDLVSSFGWQRQPVLAGLLRRIFQGPAHKFALQMLDCDRAVGESGLPVGAQHGLYNYVRDVKIFGQENVPVSGPALFLSNHPGITDTLSLFAGIGRRDLSIIALDRPFLQSLPNISAHLFYISGDSNQRMGAVKKVATHLRNGGAVLTFPAGEIEPDPDVYPGALAALGGWMDSAAMFVRFAPETEIVPVLVRNVLWDKVVNHPLLRLKRDRMERERLGAACQLLSHLVFDTRPVTVRIQFAKPISVAEVGSMQVADIHAAVLERMRGLIQNPPQDAGISVI
jgi:Acyltransferase